MKLEDDLGDTPEVQKMIQELEELILPVDE